MLSSHDKIIAHAARAALAPLGFTRIGRSRTWLADHGWWLTVVEFQPSSWSKGCYLNVAAHWLWVAKGWLSFDFGGRVASHVEYLSDDQFTPAAIQLAQSAAVEARRLTEMFADIGSTATILLDKAQKVDRQLHRHYGWSDYHAGVAAALIARTDDARRLLVPILEGPALPGSTLHPLAERISDLLGDPLQLRQEVISLIQQQRDALRLPRLTTHPF